MKQKTGKTTEKQATEDNQNVKEKKLTRTESGDTQEDTRYSQPEFHTQVRPPEESNNTRQDPPNTEKSQYQQGGTDHHNRFRNNARHTQTEVGGGKGGPKSSTKGRDNLQAEQRNISTKRSNLRTGGSNRRARRSHPCGNPQVIPPTPSKRNRARPAWPTLHTPDPPQHTTERLLS